MKVSIQVAILALVGGGVYGAYTNWDQVKPFVPAPVLALLPQPSAAPAARPGGPGGGPPPAVEVVQARTGRIIEVAESVGTARALESVSITSRVSGIVESTPFEEGQVVQQGHVLLRFDMAERRADLEAARAAVETAQAQRAEITSRLERARQLRASGAGTDAQVVDLTNNLRTTETNVSAAIARRNAAQARLDEMILRAPFAGRVGMRSVSVGALVEPRTSITTLDDLSQIRLDFAVPEALLATLAIGMPMRAQTIAYGDRVFRGTVSVIDTRIDPVTRSVRLTALIANPNLELRPGMFMTVAVDVATRENAVTIPEEAVVSEGPRQFAFVVRDGRIDRRMLRLGHRQENRVEVVDGIQAGETVVARGVQRIRHGMQVNARPMTASGSQPGTPPATPPAATPAAAPQPPATPAAPTGATPRPQAARPPGTAPN